MRQNIDEADVLRDVLEALPGPSMWDMPLTDASLADARRVIAAALDRAREQAIEDDRDGRREAGAYARERL
jgi:hypothetical protein